MRKMNIMHYYIIFGKLNNYNLRNYLILLICIIASLSDSESYSLSSK